MMKCGPKGTRTASFGNALGTIEEKTGQASVTCSRSHCDSAAGSGQECQESLFIMWRTAPCLLGLMGIQKLTAVSHRAGAQHTHAAVCVVIHETQSVYTANINCSSRACYVLYSFTQQTFIEQSYCVPGTVLGMGVNQ